MQGIDLFCGAGGMSTGAAMGGIDVRYAVELDKHRGLSVRETARLQSIPDWFRFTGSIGFQQQQVGNLVPPLLAKVVFEKILSV